MKSYHVMLGVVRIKNWFENVELFKHCSNSVYLKYLRFNIFYGKYVSLGFFVRLVWKSREFKKIEYYLKKKSQYK